VWGALYLSEEIFDLASRRLCNMTYVIFQVCLSLTDLILFFIFDRLLVTYEYNYIVEAINYNQLFYFFFVTDHLPLTTLELSDDRPRELIGVDAVRERNQLLLLRLHLPLRCGCLYHSSEGAQLKN